MSEVEKRRLPEGWVTRAVKDILVIEDGDRGKTYPQKTDFTTTGYCLFLNAKNVTANGFRFDENQFISKEKHESLRKGKLERGDIVFTSRGTIGNIAYYSDEIEHDFARINSGMFIIRGFQEHLDEKYLEYYLRSPYITAQINRLKSGTAQPQLPIKDFRKFALIFPTAIDQQKQIVAKIEELFSHIDAGIESLKKAKVLLKQYRQSVLKAAVTGELTKEWREKNKDKIEPASKLLERILKERREKWEERQMEGFRAKGMIPRDDGWKGKYEEPVFISEKFYDSIPDNWVEATIDHSSYDIRYGSSSKTNDDSSGIPVLRMGNIIDCYLDYEKLKYLPADHSEFPELLLNDGDLLFNRTNSAELVGKTAVFRSKGVKTSFASYLIGIRLLPSIEPDFLSFFINSLYGKKWIKSCVSQNVGQANVNGTKLKSLTVPLPSSEEQKEIVRLAEERFDAMVRLTSELDLKLIAAEKNKQSILAAAFSGELVK